MTYGDTNAMLVRVWIIKLATTTSRAIAGLNSMKTTGFIADETTVQ